MEIQQTENIKGENKESIQRMESHQQAQETEGRICAVEERQQKSTILKNREEKMQEELNNCEAMENTSYQQV